MPHLSYISLSDMDFSGGSWAITSDSGAGLVGFQVTIDPDYEVSSILVNDDDGMFEDDDNGDGWGDNGDPQTLGEAAVLNGTLYAAGTSLEAEYELTLSYVDGDGATQTFRMLSVKAGGMVVGYTFIDGIPPAGVTYNIAASRDSMFLPDGSYEAVGAPYIDIVPCFAAGVVLETDRGEIAVERLAPGDLVRTRDHGLQPIRWIGSRKLSAKDLEANQKLRPIRIRAGALGQSRPSADLLVSPQHRILVRSKIAQRMFGATEVLAAAKQLLQIEGIDIVQDMEGVEYFHVLFDGHEIVISNGAETESLYTGKEALKGVGPAAREEIFTLFPELRDAAQTPPGARVLLSGRQARNLAIRHTQHRRALVL